MHNLIHRETGQIVASRWEPFDLSNDGPFPGVQFSDLEVDDPKPELGEVSKLTIKRRITQAEWLALKSMLAQFRASSDESQREIAEEWDDATSIDPNDPKTQAVILALTEAGILTTPIATIFATVT
jgi:hypothetical protein